MGYIEDGKSTGARFVTGGSRHGSQGYYIKPTFIADVDMNMNIVQEIFGPVYTIQKFRNDGDSSFYPLIW